MKTDLGESHFRNDFGTLVNYIEAIVQFCEDKNIEMDGIGKLISKPLKEKLKYDAQRLNYMKRTSKAFLKL